MSNYKFILNRKLYESCEIIVEADHVDEAEILALNESRDYEDWCVDYVGDIEIDNYEKLD